jgi:hypothetical protein
MFKLNSDGVQQAWKEYREFMEGMGADFDTNNPARKPWVQQVEQAFKFAYAMGKAHQTQAIAQKLDEAKIVNVDDDPKKPITRVRTEPSRRRSDKQMVQDARLVASIMQRNAKEMKLMDICAAVNAAGGDWYEKSASGHMQKVMERIPAIKKVGYGLYKYEQ